MVNEPETDENSWYSNEAATFGDRVSAARDALGLSQADLARKLGIKQKTIQAWEDDVSEPRANRLQMLSGILNVSIMWLMNGDGEGVSPPSDDAEPAADVTAVLTEIRQIRSQMTQNAERLAQAEKRLRNLLKNSA